MQFIFYSPWLKQPKELIPSLWLNVFVIFVNPVEGTSNQIQSLV